MKPTLVTPMKRYAMWGQGMPSVATNRSTTVTGHYWCFRQSQRETPVDTVPPEAVSYKFAEATPLLKSQQWAQVIVFIASLLKLSLILIWSTWCDTTRLIVQRSTLNFSGELLLYLKQDYKNVPSQRATQALALPAIKCAALLPAISTKVLYLNMYLSRRPHWTVNWQGPTVVKFLRLLNYFSLVELGWDCDEENLLLYSCASHFDRDAWGLPRGSSVFQD